MGRKEQIVACARQLIEEQGLTKVSVQAVTDRVGCTRSLFYHYFPSKVELTSAVLDTYVDGFMDNLNEWNAGRTEGDIEGALSGIVKLAREELFGDEDAGGHFRRTLATRENASLYTEFVNRVAARSAKYITENTVVDYAKLHEVRIDHVYETFYILILGIIGYLRANPKVDDSVLKDVIAQTLHMVRN